MYRRKFLLDNSIFYDTDIIHGEDVFFTMKAYINAKVISIKTDYDYYYRVRREDGKHLSIYQKNNYDFRATQERVSRILHEINVSNNTEQYKNQWAKIFLEYRCLEKMTTRIVDAKFDDAILNDIDELILQPAGVKVLNLLDSKYRLIVKITSLQQEKQREVFMESILTPDDNKVVFLDDRMYIDASDGNTYDASLVYKALNFVIRDIYIKNSILTYGIAAPKRFAAINGRGYRLVIEELESGHVFYQDAQRMDNGEYIFRFSISRASRLSSRKSPKFKVGFIVDDIDIPFKVTKRNVESSSEGHSVYFGEKFTMYNGYLRGGDLVTELRL